MSPQTPTEPRRHTAESEAIQRTVLTLAAIGRDPRLIPETWDEQRALIDTATQMGERLVLTIAAIVSAAHAQAADKSAFLDECSQRYGWARSHLHHVRAVGDLLRRAISRHECGSATLLSLHFDKLLSLSRLPEHLLSAFLERNDVAVLSRDSVREIVNRYLLHQGVPPEAEPAPRTQRHLPARQADFLDALFAPAGDEPPQEYQQRVHARAETVRESDRSQVLFRSLVVMDALIDRMSGPFLAVLADQLRKLADSADQRSRLQEATR